MSARQHLSQEAVEAFKGIYEQEFGRRLSDESAEEIGLRLLRLFSVLGGDSLKKAAPEDSIL